MRGTFDFNKEQFPFLVQHVGIDEVVIRHQLTGEEIDRQPLAGKYGSDERKAQAQALEAKAIKLCQESRNRPSSCQPIPYEQFIPREQANK